MRYIKIQNNWMQSFESADLTFTIIDIPRRKTYWFSKYNFSNFHTAEQQLILRLDQPSGEYEIEQEDLEKLVKLTYMQSYHKSERQSVV